MENKITTDWRGICCLVKNVTDEKPGINGKNASYIYLKSKLNFLSSIGLFFAVFIFSISTLAQKPVLTTQKFTPAQLREDFQVFRQSLESAHPGLYRYESATSLNRIFDDTQKLLNRSMTELEFMRLLAPIIASIKCGHTLIGPPETVQDEIFSRRLLLPFKVKILNKKVYIFRDLSEQNGSLAGWEIVSVNGSPVAQILNRFFLSVPADGGIQTYKKFKLEDWRFAIELVQLSGMTDPYKITLYHPQRKERKDFVVKGIELPKLRSQLAQKFPQDIRPSRVADFESIDDGKIGLLKIRGFSEFIDKEKKENLKQFYRDTFEQLKSKNSKALIIDLRNNTGGKDELGKLLFSYLIDKPFDYYQDVVIKSLSLPQFAKHLIAPVNISADYAKRGGDGLFHAIGHPNWGPQTPNQPVFSGEVYILMNGGSFSTTAEFLSQAHYHKRAKFIGEEAGGAYYGNNSGDAAGLRLPNTKTIVIIPLRAYYGAVYGYESRTAGVIPDYSVQYDIEDFIEGVDKEVEIALKLARSSVK